MIARLPFTAIEPLRAGQMAVNGCHHRFNHLPANKISHRMHKHRHSIISYLLALACSTSLLTSLIGCDEKHAEAPATTPPVITPASEEVDTDTPTLVVEPPAEQQQVHQPPPSAAVSRLAIIIDDIGYNHENGLRVTQLPANITLAVLPFSPHGPELAKAAANEGKEIMLHTPMSTLGGRKLDTGGLDEHMSQADFIRTLYADLDSIPAVKGVNNHMGSRLTQQSEPMLWLMEALKTRSLYFVDSRTTADSLAYETAQENALRSAKRDIFLDNQRSPEAIAKQLRKAIRIAEKKGYAIAIGHPYNETLDVLEKLLPELISDSQVQLVPASAVVTADPEQHLLRLADHRDSDKKELKSNN